MHVVQVLPELNVGGVERGTLQIAAALVAAGHRSTVISAGGALVGELTGGGTRHVEMPVHAKSLSVLSQIAPLRNTLSVLHPDVVHVRSRLPAWLVWFAMKRLPVDARPHLVTTVHGLYGVHPYSAIMTRGDRVIAISRAVLDYISANYPRVDVDVIRLVHRGVDQSEYPTGYRPTNAWMDLWQRDFPNLPGKRLLVLPGRLTRWKGAELFLDLLSALVGEFPDVAGVIVGGPDPKRPALLGELQRRASSLGIAQHVAFTGHRDDVREWLSVATLAFNLSTHPEPFGRTVIEALSLGTPVVAFDSGGPAETVRACFPIGLVPDQDTRALAERVANLLRGDIPPVGPCEFSLARMQAETLAIYEELVGH